jgi:hypothetical protein
MTVIELIEVAGIVVDGRQFYIAGIERPFVGAVRDAHDADVDVAGRGCDVLIHGVCFIAFV